MAKLKGKVFTSDEQIRTAVAAAQADPSKVPLAKSVTFQSDLDAVLLVLTDGSRYIIPREKLQGLREARPEALLKIERLGNGLGIHWPDLDVSFSV